MRRTENNRRPSGGSQPWASLFRPGRVLRDLLEPMFWGSSAYSDFFGQSTPTTHMRVQRNLRARACSGPAGQLPGGRPRRSRRSRPGAERAFDGRDRCRGDRTRCRTDRTTGEVPYGRGDGRRRGRAARSPPSLPHRVAQPATGRGSPTHRFHPRTPGPPLCRPTGHRPQFADTPVACIGTHHCAGHPASG